MGRQGSASCLLGIPCRWVFFCAIDYFSQFKWYLGGLCDTPLICTSATSSMGVFSDSLRLCVSLKSASALLFAFLDCYLIVNLNNASSAVHLCSTVPSLAI